MLIFLTILPKTLESHLEDLQERRHEGPAYKGINFVVSPEIFSYA